MSSRITFPNFCFDHIYDPNKNDPVSLHLATFKKGGGGSPKDLFTPSKCIWMQVLSASDFTAGQATDHTAIRPETIQSYLKHYRQKETFKRSSK